MNFKNLLLLNRYRLFSSKAQNKLFPQKFNIIYDSSCYLCNKEIEYLKVQNTNNIFLFTDLENKKERYNPNDVKNVGITYGDAMRKMHIVKNDGSVITGKDAFYEIYKSIGMGKFLYFTQLPIIGDLSDRVYNFWAKYRTSITRGENIENIINRYESSCNYKNTKI